MLLVLHHVNIDDGEFQETDFVGLFSDHYFANRAIEEAKAKVLEMDGESDWDDYPDHSFEIRDLKVNERMWPR